jgi:short subunit dehydrogenase-like uncharacterized protein
MASDATIAVYGATGYTGRLVVAALRDHGLRPLLAGRDPERLRAVADELGVDAPVRPAGVHDPGALRHAFGDCAAVINCAGPFTRLGEPVLKAAIESGTHYLDTTGEQPWMRRMQERWDGAAHAGEVAVVNAMGFDYVPGDLLAHVVAQGHEPLEDIVIAYAVAGFGASRGTLRSILEMAKGGDLEYSDGHWRAGTGEPVRSSFQFPDPLGRVAMTHYPAGEVVTVPRHVDTRRVITLISSNIFAPHPAFASVAPKLVRAGAPVMRTPASLALDVAVGLLPEGPDEDARRGARFTIGVLARGENASVGRGIVRGSDVYGLTAEIATHAAELMAAPGYDRAGVLAPAQAFDARAFLDALGEHGLTYELGVAT